MPWMIPAAIVAGSAITAGASYLSSKSAGGASDQSREAGRRQVELGRNQSLINSQTMSPYIGAGMGAMQQLYGYSPVQGSTGNYGSGSRNAFTVPQLNATGDKWDSPTTVGGTSYAKTGPGFDPTGGAGKYSTQLEGLSPNLQYNSYNPGQYIDKMNAFSSDFKFNENDPAYQYQKSIAERDINRQAAARGLYGSRAALNQLDESGRAITASEYDKQYGRGRQNIMDQYGMAGTEESRKYGEAVDLYGRTRGNITDLYNMALQRGNIGYNALLDAVKIGTGSGATAGSLGNQAAGNLSNAYGQMSQNAFASANNQNQMYGNMGAAVTGGMNNYMLYNALSGNQNQSGVNNSQAFLNYGTNAGQYGSNWQ